MLIKSKHIQMQHATHTSVPSLHLAALPFSDLPDGNTISLLASLPHLSHSPPPPTHTFSRAQKAASAAAAKAAPLRKVVFAYASQTGTAAEVARNLYAEAVERKLQAEVRDFDLGGGGIRGGGRRGGGSVSFRLRLEFNFGGMRGRSAGFRPR